MEIAAFSSSIAKTAGDECRNRYNGRLNVIFCIHFQLHTRNQPEKNSA